MFVIMSMVDWLEQNTSLDWGLSLVEIIFFFYFSPISYYAPFTVLQFYTDTSFYINCLHKNLNSMLQH